MRAEDTVVAFDAYIAEVGDLDLGLHGTKKRGRGVMLEIPDGEVCIAGLTKPQCQALGSNLRLQVTVTIALKRRSAP